MIVVPHLKLSEVMVKVFCVALVERIHERTLSALLKSVA